MHPGLIRIALLLAALGLVDRAHALDGSAKTTTSKGLVGEAPADSARALIDRIETTMAAGDPSVLDAAFSPEALVNKAVREFDGTDATVAGFVRGALHEMQRHPGVGTQFLANMASSDEEPIARFKRTRVVETSPGVFAATYRVLMSDDMCNYIEFEFVRREGRWIIDDLFDHASADRRSEFMRRTLMNAVTDLKRPALMRLIDGRDFAAESESVKAVTAAARAQGDPKEIMRLFEAMSEEFQREPLLLAMYCTAASRVDDPTYRRALERMLATLDDPKALPLMRIDAHTLAGDFDQARAATRTLEKLVNDPAYMSYMRGSLYILQKQQDLATTEFEHAIARDPTLAGSYWVLVQWALDAKNYDRVAHLLTQVETHTGLAMGDLSTVPAYAGFVASRQYKAWLSTR
jgi:predicted negative regulator of RcsB-dependent stress response